ncbi:hypothetical protein SAMN05444349_12344 [Bacteroides faecichinchillae]|uniref:Lipoprotein n=2 Tax=Bacteroides faecichinchillae TaxID=871325 RepID=A0A1M5CAF2_9BACE|nr:hypothetical protein SAMN05444349_12344 [Bacteroides faecichinchillae]
MSARLVFCFGFLYVCALYNMRHTVMEKILFLLVMLPMFIFTGCSSDDEEPPRPSTYTLFWEFRSVEPVADVIVFEYNSSGDKIANKRLTECETGAIETFQANDKVVKVKICILMNSKNNWVQNVYYLEEGKNINIYLDEDVLIGNDEP